MSRRLAPAIRKKIARPSRRKVGSVGFNLDT
jgi:hypothetical protein